MSRSPRSHRSHRTVLASLVATSLLAVSGSALAQKKTDLEAVLADDTHDLVLHAAHQDAAAPQAKLAGSFAKGMMERAAAGKVDLSGYVADVKQLSALGSKAPPESAKDLMAKHEQELLAAEKAIGLPGLLALFAGQGSAWQPTIDIVPLGGPAPPGICGQCRDLLFEAPHHGGSWATYPLGARAVSPDRFSHLTAEYSAGVAWAGHSVAATGERFEALVGDRVVSASATMELHTDIGVGGLGLAHGWSDVQLVVTDLDTGAERCRSRVETANIATGAWYRRDTQNLGVRVIGDCRFERNPAVAGSYAVAIELRAYGTYAGLSGGFSRIDADFKKIDVELCPLRRHDQQARCERGQKILPGFKSPFGSNVALSRVCRSMRSSLCSSPR